ncbi:MAG: HEXXH motif domain-containing protein [Pseudonocardia sp.]|nr:HEXXH motif domain-containing protein [Pseudonocardia sp.]
MRIDDILDLEPITVAQHRRTQEIHAVLDPSCARPHSGSPSESALTYTLAHHFLEGARAAAQHRNPTELAWYRTTHHHDLTHLALPAPNGSTLVIAPNRGELLRSSLSDTAYYLINQSTRFADGRLRRLVADAITFAGQAGFSRLIGRHGSVICLLRQREPRQTLHSWSISRLPGTIYTEHCNDPWILARDLIHEAGHHWLNNALTATNTNIPDTVSYFSPWRDAQRPAYAFIHACWAFSLTILYTTRILSTVNIHTTRDLLNRYLTEQHLLLHDAATNIEPALDLLAPSLRIRVARTLTAASNLAAFHPESSAPPRTAAP